jgi:phosphate transport system substrate-binding protein
MKNWLSLYVLIMIIAILSACSDTKSSSNEKIGNGETITISGSTSVGPLAEKLAMKYEELVNVKIEVNQIGSSAGIANAMNGVSQIGMSSRDLKQVEMNSGIEELVIAYDGIVVVAHPTNPVKDLTMEQIKQIFTGEITNWKDVGGKDMEIVVVSREDGSGSRDAFQEIVGYKSGQLIRNAIIASGNGNIKTTVAMNKHAIGFISFEYIDASISTMNINRVEATAENVLNGSYSLSRPFLFVHKGEVSAAAQAFIDYIFTPEAQKIVEQAGAIPLIK